MTKDQFIGRCVAHMIKHGVSVTFYKTKKVMMDGEPLGGAFVEDGKNLEFHVATGSKEWFATFVHEYCHFLQYLDKVSDSHPVYIWTRYEEWRLGERKLSAKTALKYNKIIQFVELDAEKRAVKLIKKYKLDLDVDYYIRRANTYVLFYNLVHKYKKWYKKNSPYNLPELIELMPNKFLKDLDTVPKEFEDIVVQKVF